MCSILKEEHYLVPLITVVHANVKGFLLHLEPGLQEIYWKAVAK